MERREVALAKVLAAVAWADGELTSEETSAIEKIGLDLGLDAQERAEVGRLLEAPVGIEEAVRIADELFAGSSAEESAAFLARVEKVISADSRVDPREVALLTRLREAAGERDKGGDFLVRALGLLRSTLGRSGESTGGIAGRILSRIGGGTRKHPIDRDRFEKALLFGAILQRVAYADSAIDPSEETRVRELLAASYSFSSEEVETVLSVLRTRTAEDLDRQRLCASFNRLTEMDERLRLLGAVFLIASADGRVDEAEMREMRLIANYLWINAREFHRVRSELERSDPQA